jgi:type I restriction enzyme R subunit
MTEELEWQTRRDRINKKLQSLQPAWQIIKYSDEIEASSLVRHAVEEYPTASGPADYALFVDNKLLGIIEAKKVGVGPQNVLEQAKRYARTVFAGAGNWNGYRVPFLYASNGEAIWHLDARDEKNLSRRIANFHTPSALAEFWQSNRAAGLDWLQNNPIDIDRLHSFQRHAIEATEKELIKGKRSLLIAMATGTGKTFTTVSLIHHLLQSKIVRRVLFLVDRRSLAAQAVREFSSFNTPSGHKFNQEYEVYSQRFRREDFEDDQNFNPQILPASYLTAPQLSHTFVYVSTIQRMTVNLFGWENAFRQSSDDPDYEEDASKLDIPIHAFDLIIADECHRGYTASETATWRQVMEYFDAIRIGLTATPAPHSLSLFREVVFRYTTEQAILDGFLVDYDAVKLRSGVRMQGAFLKQGEHVGIIDPATGQETYDELEDERAFPSEEIEKKITAPDSNRKIIKEIAKHAYEHEQQYGRFPKILIFAVNDLPHISHCDQLVTICREEFGQGDDFVQKITGSPSVDRPLQKIREFRNRPKPKIVVSVDMLSTGVDIPCLEFIVFLRPVKSRILWVQMLGRGTRRCHEINKEKFVIFDCFDGTLIEYFKNTTDFRIEPPRKEPVPLARVIENIYQNVDREYFVKVLLKRLRRIERTMGGEAREKFAPYIPEGDVGKFAAGLAQSMENDFAATMKLLRDPDFQDLLLNYPRPRRSFLVGYEVEDQVSSEVMVRVGQEYQKPEDYLDGFARFVRDNPEQVEAITILLKRPKEWRTTALNELREKLARHNYEEKVLQRAHKLVHNKALADIISMVKHAALADEPIYTAEERVDRAMHKVTASRTFTGEQLQWLGYIREHLVENLTIDEDDLESAPVFERHGGKGRARQVFPEQLEALLTEINFAVAA